MKKIIIFCFMSFVSYGSFLICSKPAFLVCSKPRLSLDLTVLSDQTSTSPFRGDWIGRRQKSREFSTFLKRLASFQMSHANVQRLCDVDKVGMIEQMKPKFQDFVSQVLVWQDENREFIMNNLFLTDEDTCAESTPKVNPYNDAMLPSIERLSGALGVILPLLCKVVRSCPSSPSSPVSSVFSFPGSPAEKTEQEHTVRVSRSRGLDVREMSICDESMSMRLRRTPHMSKSRLSLDELSIPDRGSFCE